MKRIKDNSLLKSIPESATIQGVLDLLYPTVFTSKTEAKYFLAILGDNIFKKNTNLIHYISHGAKPFITELNNLCQFVIGTHLIQTFKYKYHDNHNYNDCRLIKINNCIKSDNIWIPIIEVSVLDLLCVACHYSIRYASSDNVIIQNSNDYELSRDVFYLRDMKPEDMISVFIQEYIQITNASNSTRTMVGSQLQLENNSKTIRATQISWKNMQYLWRQFLDTKNLPSIMFQQTLKTFLIQRLKDYYHEDLDSFVGICSKSLPDIQTFLTFWNETVVIDENEMDFEIEEMVFLFRKWCQENNETISNLSDKQIVDLIAYYYSDVEIERDKYICKIRCSLWDKQLDIQVALDNMRQKILSKIHAKYGGSENFDRPSSPSLRSNISIYDAYNYYCKYFSNIPDKQMVNKSYFEKYVFENFDDYVIDSKFLSYEWLIDI
jgi:hypothetical protein